MVLAKEAGLLYAAVALATDYDCWRSTGDNVCVEDVLAMFQKNIGKVQNILIKSIEKIAKIDWTPTIQDLKVTSIYLCNKKQPSNNFLFLSENGSRKCYVTPLIERLLLTSR